MRQVTGATAARLYTPPLRTLTRKTSHGYAVADFAEQIGSPLLPWERWAAIHALEKLPGGGLRFRTVLILAARQNGKSHLKRIISLWRLYKMGARLVVGTAQDLDLAREQWQFCVETIEDCPLLAAELDPAHGIGKVSRTNGNEYFRLAGGGRYKIKAANRRAGRGPSVDEVTFDELREQTNWQAWAALSKTTTARADGQVWAMSNAGDDQSVVLNQLRDNALAGRDPTLGIFEWSGPDGCELDDPKAIAAANPALGRLISMRAIMSSLGTDPPAIYRTEVLCQRVEQLSGAYDYDAWRECTDPAGTMAGLRDRIAACFDIAPDGGHATLAVAARLRDGRIRTEIAGAWESVEHAFAELPALLDRIRPVTVAWYATGPGAGFSPMLRGRRGPVELTGAKVAEACMGLGDVIKARQVVHPGQALAGDHVRAARKLAQADGWRLTRHGGGHVDAAYATAGAVQLARAMPERRGVGLRIISA